jgi:hypothetical protein
MTQPEETVEQSQAVSVEQAIRLDISVALIEKLPPIPSYPDEGYEVALLKLIATVSDFVIKGKSSVETGQSVTV